MARKMVPCGMPLKGGKGPCGATRRLAKNVADCEHCGVEAQRRREDARKQRLSAKAANLNAHGADGDIADTATVDYEYDALNINNLRLNLAENSTLDVSNSTITCEGTGGNDSYEKDNSIKVKTGGSLTCEGDIKAEKELNIYVGGESYVSNVEQSSVNINGDDVHLENITPSSWDRAQALDTYSSNITGFRNGGYGFITNSEIKDFSYQPGFRKEMERIGKPDSNAMMPRVYTNDSIINGACIKGMHRHVDLRKTVITDSDIIYTAQKTDTKRSAPAHRPNAPAGETILNECSLQGATLKIGGMDTKCTMSGIRLRDNTLQVPPGVDFNMKAPEGKPLDLDTTTMRYIPSPQGGWSNMEDPGYIIKDNRGNVWGHLPYRGVPDGTLAPIRVVEADNGEKRYEVDMEGCSKPLYDYYQKHGIESHPVGYTIDWNDMVKMRYALSGCDPDGPPWLQED